MLIAPLQVLEQALVEVVLVSPGAFKRSNSRIFDLLLVGQEKLLGACGSDDSLASVSECSSLIRNAAHEIAKQVRPEEASKGKLSEEAGCAFIASLGRWIVQGRTRELIEATVDRLRAEHEAHKSHASLVGVIVGLMLAKALQEPHKN